MRIRSFDTLIFLVLTFSFSTDCNGQNKVNENPVKETSANSDVLKNQTPVDLPPNKSVFTKEDAIIVFQEDDEVLKRENGMVRIYDESGVVWNVISYFDDSRDSMSQPGDKFRPFSFRAGDFVLKMRCTGKSDHWYEVIVDEEVSPKVKKYVRVDDPLFEVRTWEKYILGFGWVVFDHEKNPILQSPDGKKKDIRLSKDMRFVPVEMQGDWLKIRQEEADSKQINKANSNNSGWIRWREGEKVLVYEFYP